MLSLEFELIGSVIYLLYACYTAYEIHVEIHLQLVSLA